MHPFASSQDRVLLQCLPPTPLALRSAREGVRAALAGLVPAGLLEDVVLVVSELVSNSVRHAGLAEDQRIILTVHAAETIRVEVEDPGTGFDGELPAERPLLEGGQGLRIVERLSARWGVVRGTRTLAWADLRGSS